MLLALAGLCSRADNAGVTSFVRVLNFRAQAYHRFLHLFHSDALDLDVLRSKLPAANARHRRFLCPHH